MTFPSWRQEEPPQPILMEIHGNAYEAVPSRIKRFRHDHPYGCVETLVAPISDESRVMAVTKVWSDPAVTCNERVLLATGTAVEERSERGVNSTSCEENAETSSIGRALGIAGYDAANSVATAEEVGAAIAKQDAKPAAKRKAAPAKASPPPATNQEEGSDGLLSGTFTVTEVIPKLKRDGTPVQSAKGAPCMAIHTAEGVVLETFFKKFYALAEEAMQFGQQVTAEYNHDPKWKSNSLEEIKLVAGEPAELPDPADTPEVAEEEIPF